MFENFSNLIKRKTHHNLHTKELNQLQLEEYKENPIQTYHSKNVESQSRNENKEIRKTKMTSLVQGNHSKINSIILIRNDRRKRQ